LLLLTPALLLLARVLGTAGMALLLVVIFPMDNALYLMFTLVYLTGSEHKFIPVLLLAYQLYGAGYNPDLITCNIAGHSTVNMTTPVPGPGVQVTTSPSTPNAITSTTLAPTPDTTPSKAVPTTTLAPTTTTIVPTTTVAAPEECKTIKCDLGVIAPRDVIASILCVTKCTTKDGPINTVDEWLAQECSTITCGAIPPFGKFEYPSHGVDNYRCGVWVLLTPGSFWRCTEDLGPITTTTTTTTTPAPTTTSNPFVVSGPF